MKPRRSRSSPTRLSTSSWRLSWRQRTSIESYPAVYVGLSMVAQTLVVVGLVLFGLNAGASFARFWRWVFPLMILEVLVGLWFDATIPPEALQSEWGFNVALSLWLVAPAYYFNFRIAQYRRAEREH